MLLLTKSNNNNNNNNNNNGDDDDDDDDDDNDDDDDDKIDNKRMKWSGKTINAISRAFAKCDAFYPLRHVKHLS